MSDMLFASDEWLDATQHLMDEYMSVVRSIPSPTNSTTYDDWMQWEENVANALKKRVEAEKQFEHLKYK